tara:strand:- start:87 stop:530 length:444 start_codon:yes stop_codon:yes gene_type:complete
MRPSKSKIFRLNEKDSGFTLLELLVVLVIIGLLTTIVGPQVMKMLGNAKGDVARVQLENIGIALDLFNLDVGRYPTQEEGLKILIEKPEDLERWNGPYLKSDTLPKDPWARLYIYTNPGKGTPYSLQSYGADGQPGGTSENSDIILK